MDLFAGINGYGQGEPWTIGGLDPLPEEEWQRMRGFLALSDAEVRAMLTTVEALFKRGHELVVGTYDYLLRNEETAAILGWEEGADPAHLAERRRFFTVWLARLLGMDFSADLAHYLFRAGKFHAAHGPRHTHVPPVYVTGSISLVNATFARFIMEEMPGHRPCAAGPGRLEQGADPAPAPDADGLPGGAGIDQGDFAVPFVMFGRMRTVTGAHDLPVHVADGADGAAARCASSSTTIPQARGEVFDAEWSGGERIDAHGTPWFTVERAYAVKPMWRVLLNGKDLSYIGGPAISLAAGDEIHIFPPGR